MNILFLTNDLYPYQNANSEIAYRVAHEISKYEDCHVSILGFNRSVDTVFPDPFKDIETIRMGAVTEYMHIVMTAPNAVKRILNLLQYPKSFRCYWRARKGDKYWLAKEYRREILDILRRKQVDCIIAFSAPVDTLLALAGLDCSIHRIAYMLDPWSSHYENADDPGVRELEARVVAKMDRIITLEMYKRDYQIHADAETLKKIVTVEFPNVMEYAPQKKIAGFDDGRIHCVFAGALYHDIRKPDYMVNLFGKLRDKGIVLHLMGVQYGGSLLPDPLPENIVYHGKLPSDEAMQYMQSAHILVNIGNTILNQMPSKLLTYISFGKPILNIVKSRNCPTLKFTENYPLALDILETVELREEDYAMAETFILQNASKNIPFEIIKDLYRECTPEYVGHKVYDTLCEVIQSK